MTLKQAADFINQVGEAWIGLKSERTIYQVMADAATHCSSDRTKNCAAYLKANFGHSRDTMTEADWLAEAEALLEISRNTI